MKQERLKEILAQIKNVKVAVYGDFCLDAYWILDPHGSEVSVETGLQARGVRKHYYSLGGASNVVANLVALEPAGIQVIGVIGDDIFGRELKRQLQQLGVDTSYLVVQEKKFDTVVFGKPYLKGNEDARIDFGFFNERSQKTDTTLIEGIRKTLQNTDILIFNQQVPGGITNESFIDGANALFEQFSDKIVLLDSRHYGDKFKHIYRKTNDLEAARLNGVQVDKDDVLRGKDIETYGRNLYGRFNKPVFLTLGPRGILTVDTEGVHRIPGIQLIKKIDPVGAGDTVTSALALCLGGGVPPAEASEFANFAAAVTVQKLFRTGTASAEEILAVGVDADYIYQPELASDRRIARYHDKSEIELCCESIPLGRIKHAVFDNDGTISTLRQGWEKIMAPTMVKAILGDHYKAADVTLYHQVRRRVAEYIDKSTGIQTILQMEALVEMVKEFRIVPTDRILDAVGYKEIYNKHLIELVNRRIEKVKRGELEIGDYTLKGSLAFLRALRQRGISLYLASGTDREDVLRESAALGYAELFEGRIYGALGDVTKYSKKMVINDIMRENNLEGAQLAVFGDGPVELRECRKRSGLAIGVASDEVRRYGLNIEKRTRLVRAGAQIIVPDFSQWDRLIELLFQE
jgi:rfaE bifunctional protein kinase chain/domain